MSWDGHVVAHGDASLEEYMFKHRNMKVGSNPGKDLRGNGNISETGTDRDVGIAGPTRGDPGLTFRYRTIYRIYQ